MPGVPENTLAAFREAHRQGAHIIEFDLRASKDGALVVMHDATLERTTNGRGRVADQTLAQLKRLDAGHGERIPTCEEVLRLLAGTGVQLLLDIKESPDLDQRHVVRLVEQHDLRRNVILGLRSIADVRSFQAVDPALRTLGLVGNVGDIEPFVRAGVDVIRLKPGWIRGDPGLVGRLQRLGRQVWVTTDDAPRGELEKLVQLGVDGIITDFPAVMRTLLADAARPRRGLPTGSTP